MLSFGSKVQYMQILLKTCFQYISTLNIVRHAGLPLTDCILSLEATVAFSVDAFDFVLDVSGAFDVVVAFCCKYETRAIQGGTVRLCNSCTSRDVNIPYNRLLSPFCFSITHRKSLRRHALTPVELWLLLLADGFFVATFDFYKRRKITIKQNSAL